MEQFQIVMINKYGQADRTDFADFSSTRNEFDYLATTADLRDFTYIQMNDRDGNVVEQYVRQIENAKFEAAKELY